MLAIVMCGGRGSRLGFVEKPLIPIRGVRLIEIVIQELEITGVESIFVTSKYTPETESVLRKQGLEVFRASGKGYMEDLRETILEYRLCEPVMNLNSDLYIRRHGLLQGFLRKYLTSNSPALSAVYPDGRRVGINAFDPMFEQQREERFITDERDVINIDTPADLERAENG